MNIHIQELGFLTQEQVKTNCPHLLPFVEKYPHIAQAHISIQAGEESIITTFTSRAAESKKAAIDNLFSCLAEVVANKIAP